MKKVLVIEDEGYCGITHKEDWEQKDWLVSFTSIAPNTSIKKIIKTIDATESDVVFIKNHYYSNGMKFKNIVKKIKTKNPSKYMNIKLFTPSIS